jgi:hypothetical protein
MSACAVQRWPGRGRTADLPIFRTPWCVRIRSAPSMTCAGAALKNSRVEVVLSEVEAFAVGEFKEAENVYLNWARPRQTTIKPYAFAFPRYEIHVLVVMCILALVSSFVSLIVVQTNYITLVMLSVIVVTCLVLYWYGRDFIHREYSDAVIVPLSLDEHRQIRTSQTYLAEAGLLQSLL